MVAKDHPDRIKLDDERIKYWLGVGAQPSERVARFLGAAKLAPLFARPAAWRLLDAFVGCVMWAIAAGLIWDQLAAA